MSNPNDLPNQEKDDYVPPGERLITPVDVVEIDPDMTVAKSVRHVRL